MSIQSFNALSATATSTDEHDHDTNYVKFSDIGLVGSNISFPGTINSGYLSENSVLLSIKYLQAASLGLSGGNIDFPGTGTYINAPELKQGGTALSSLYSPQGHNHNSDYVKLTDLGYSGSTTTGVISFPGTYINAGTLQEAGSSLSSKYVQLTDLGLSGGNISFPGSYINANQLRENNAVLNTVYVKYPTGNGAAGQAPVRNAANNGWEWGDLPTLYAPREAWRLSATLRYGHFFQDPWKGTGQLPVNFYAEADSPDVHIPLSYVATDTTHGTDLLIMMVVRRSNGSFEKWQFQNWYLDEVFDYTRTTSGTTVPDSKARKFASGSWPSWTTGNSQRATSNNKWNWAFTGGAAVFDHTTDEGLLIHGGFNNTDERAYQIFTASTANGNSMDWTEVRVYYWGTEILD